MRPPALLFSYLQLLPLALALPANNLPDARQSSIISSTSSSDRRLTGRFLHITDIHPDPFYEHYAATTKEAACHRGSGAAGVYGAELSDCDSPIALVNATFDWIKENLADSIDFVLWTGDSARHDNDERIPRQESQVLDSNRFIVSKFAEVFGKDENLNDTDPTNDFKIPIVPTFGNNDILPHNIFLSGPNRWTSTYLNVWRQFIPEEQRHQFHTGGWFHVEVIPNKLAVFSLNTLYFFDSNSAVDGCAIKSEPGYEQFEWLRIQLNFLRIRGVKAILMGHVPPARTNNKMSWDETCWQKYTLWMQQYRDVIVGSIYGHMNVEHFMLQDFTQLRKDVRKGKLPGVLEGIDTLEDEDGEISLMSAGDYLKDLRDDWAELPSPPKKKDQKSTAKQWWHVLPSSGKKKGDGKSKYLGEIGGEYGERFSISHVQASIVPNYFSALRVFEYNITGLEDILESRRQPVGRHSENAADTQKPLQSSDGDDADLLTGTEREMIATLREGKKESRQKRKAKGSKKYKFKVPDSPASTTPPGPAYSPQPLTLVGYTQYFANITYINNDYHHKDDFVDGRKWHEGKHPNEPPMDEDGQERVKPKPRKFKFHIEYDTFSDKVYGLKDLTVRSYIDLARLIGESKKASQSDLEDVEEDGEDVQSAKTGSKKDKKKKGKKGKSGKQKRKTHISKTWFTFLKRAFVSAMPPEDIRDEFGSVSAQSTPMTEADEVWEL